MVEGHLPITAGLDVITIARAQPPLGQSARFAARLVEQLHHLVVLALQVLDLYQERGYPLKRVFDMKQIRVRSNLSGGVKRDLGEAQRSACRFFLVICEWNRHKGSVDIFEKPTACLFKPTASRRKNSDATQNRFFPYEVIWTVRSTFNIKKFWKTRKFKKCCWKYEPQNMKIIYKGIASHQRNRSNIPWTL